MVRPDTQVEPQVAYAGHEDDADDQVAHGHEVGADAIERGIPGGRVVYSHMYIYAQLKDRLR